MKNMQITSKTNDFTLCSRLFGWEDSDTKSSSSSRSRRAWSVDPGARLQPEVHKWLIAESQQKSIKISTVPLGGFCALLGQGLLMAQGHRQGKTKQSSCAGRLVVLWICLKV